MLIQQKIYNKSAEIAVLGLGYVGLPLIDRLVNAGFSVAGIDIDLEKVNNLKKGITSDPLLSHCAVDNAEFTTDFSYLQNSDVDIICVPTPLKDDLSPDISPVINAAEKIAENMRREKLIIIESTVYPGAVGGEIIRIFNEKGLIHDKDYFIVYSPERIDPGNERYGLVNTPKVIGGKSSKALHLACDLYKNIVNELVPVSSLEVAEISKLLENSFRCLNIAFINELELFCQKIGINVYEVIRAAETKPFGFMPFYPGPGVGGHCISTDPAFLTWKGKRHDSPLSLLEKAFTLNSERPGQVAKLISNYLNKTGKIITENKVLLIGITYKKNVADLRESPAIKIFQLLLSKGVNVNYYDPLVPEITVMGKNYRSNYPSSKLLKDMDCVVITTDHEGINYDFIQRYSSMLIDTRGVKK